LPPLKQLAARFLTALRYGEVDIVSIVVKFQNDLDIGRSLVTAEFQGADTTFEVKGVIGVLSPRTINSVVQEVLTILQQYPH
jgi:hypothetical protein